MTRPLPSCCGYQPNHCECIPSGTLSHAGNGAGEPTRQPQPFNDRAHQGADVLNLLHEGDV